MRLIIALAATLLTLASSGAHASTSSPGYASAVTPLDNGVVWFNSAGARTSAPTCQGSYVPTRWAIDVRNASGQAKLALLLTAYALRKPIIVVGAGACTLSSDTETADHLYTAD